MFLSIYILTLCFLPLFAFLLYIRKNADKDKDEKQVQEILNEMLASTKAVRVFISEIKHSIDLSSVGENITLKIIYSTDKKKYSESILQTFKNKIIDVFLEKIWADVEKDSKKTLRTEFLPEGHIKDFYKDNDIQLIKLFYLSRKKDKMYQCSVHYDSKNNLDEKIIDMTLEFGILGLKEILK